MKIKDALVANLLFPLVESFSTTQCWSSGEKTLGDHMRNYPNVDISFYKLQNLLKSAKELPFWSDKSLDAALCKNNIMDALSGLPITNKADYIQNFPEKVVSIVKEAEHQPLFSGGTSDRMAVITDFAKRDSLRGLENVNIALSHGSFCADKTLDIPPSSCNVTCGLVDSGPQDVLPYIMWATKTKQWKSYGTVGSLRGRIERNWLMNRETVEPFTPGSWLHLFTQVDHVIDKLMKSRFKVLRGYPLFIYWIALRADQRGVQLPHLKTVIPYGGLAGEVMISHIKKCLNVDFFNLYGTGEVGSIGASEVNESLIKVYQQDVIVEIIDNENNVITKAGQDGRVVVTDLNNVTMPIIRYAVGDIGRWRDDSKGARGLILGGRTVEVVMGLNDELNARSLQNIIFSDLNVINYQLTRLRKPSLDMFEVNVVVKDNDLPYLFVSKLSDWFDKNRNGQKIRVNTVDFISPAASGKYLGYKEVYINKTPFEVAGKGNVFKKHFPLLDRTNDHGQIITYLDNAATAPKPQCVIDAVTDVLTNRTSNVHRGAHFIGDEVTDLFENARASIAKFVGGNPGEIILLRNTTECINFIAQQPECKKVITSIAEHHANFIPWKERILLPLNDLGSPDIGKLEALLKVHPGSTVALAHISNVTGIMIDVERVVRITKKYNGKVLLDAAQSAPHMQLDVKHLGVDYLVFSGHKVGGPTGVGVLWVRSEVMYNLSPVQWGGGMIETVDQFSFTLKDAPWCFEAGTPAIESVVGLCEAVNWLMSIGMDNVNRHVSEITRYARHELLHNVNIKVVGSESAPGPISLQLDADVHLVARMLSERHGVCVRAGYHCAQPLHSYLGIKGTLRISPWIGNSKDDIDNCIMAIMNIMKSI